MSNAATLSAGGVTERRSMIRTRSFQKTNIEALFDQLRSERFTGRVTIDVSQGSVCTMSAEDKTALPHLTGNNNQAYCSL